MGIAMQAFGAGASAVGSYKQAQTQQDVLNYQSKVAANNAEIANEQASQALVVGAQQETNSMLHTGTVMGAQRAAMAANGITLDQGTATDVLTSTQAMGNVDQLTIHDNALRQAWGYKNQAQNFINDASVNGAMASSINPMMSGATSLIGGAVGVDKSWRQYQYANTGQSTSMWSNILN